MPGKRKKRADAQQVRKPLHKPTRQERAKARRTVILKVVAVVAVLAMCGALAAFVGDSDYYATVLGWAPLIACIALITVAFAYLQVIKRRLVLKDTTDFDSCERGEGVWFTVRFKNSSALFFPRIEARLFVLDLYGKEIGSDVTTLALAPHETYDLRFKTRFDHIGTYRAGLDSVVITDFLRLFTATIPGPRTNVIQVTPHVVRIGNMRLSNNAVVETTRARRSVIADSTNYAGVRDYVKGDPMKIIHWKLSAKSRKYYSRVYEAYTNSGVAVVMDFSGPEGSADELMGMFDCVVETALSVMEYARERGIDVELHYVDKSGKHICRSSVRNADMASVMAGIPLFASDAELHAGALDLVRDLARVPYGMGNLAVCTANISPEMLTSVISAKNRNREPMLYAVASSRLEGRDKDRWMAPLSRLDNAGVGYRVLSRSEELEGVRR